MHYCFFMKASQKKDIALASAGKGGSGILKEIEYA
jgi:hypothetical protein